MNRIVCFADSGTIASTIAQELGHLDVHMLSASRLSADVRSTVQRLAPDVILFELNRAMDNAHLFFFLRADQSTRFTPLILVSPSEYAEQQAAILGADAVLSRSSLTSQLKQLVLHMLPREQMVAA